MNQFDVIQWVSVDMNHIDKTHIKLQMIHFDVSDIAIHVQN